MDREKNRNTLFYYLYCAKAEKNDLTSEELETIEIELNKERDSKRGEALQSTAECLATASQGTSPQSKQGGSPTKKPKAKIVLKPSERSLEDSIDPSNLPSVISKKVSPNPLKKFSSAGQAQKESSPIERNSNSIERSPPNQFGDFNSPAFKSYDDRPKGKVIVINSKLTKTYEDPNEHSYAPHNGQAESHSRANKPAFRSVEPSRYREGQNHNEILNMVHNTQDRRDLRAVSYEPSRYEKADYYSNEWENQHNQNAYVEEESPASVKKKRSSR